MNKLKKRSEKPSVNKRNPMPSRDLVLWALDFSMYVIIATLMLLLSDSAIANVGKRMISLLILMVFVFGSRMIFNVYRQVWRYATGHEYLSVIWADLVGGSLYLLFSFVLKQWNMQLMVWQTITVVAVNCLAPVLP